MRFDLNKRSANDINKSTSVARGADMQLGSSSASALLPTKVDLWNLIMGRGDGTFSLANANDEESELRILLEQAWNHFALYTQCVP